jgi:hypothetical protein
VGLIEDQAVALEPEGGVHLLLWKLGGRRGDDDVCCPPAGAVRAAWRRRGCEVEAVVVEAVVQRWRGAWWGRRWCGGVAGGVVGSQVVW